MDALIVKNLVGDLPERNLEVSELQALKNYQLADDAFYQSSKIDLLIGVNGYCQFTRPGKNFVRKDELWMINSVFGWLICGGRDDTPGSQMVNVKVVADVDKQLEQFWKLDGIEEDIQCENRLAKSAEIDRDESGRYVVWLPFVNQSPRIGQSLTIAKKQFDRLEVRFDRDENFRRHYIDFMTEYENLDHMKKMSQSEVNSNEPCCYIPYHGIYQRGKIRVVFNAACKTSNGRSLNEELITGPNLQAKLVDILTRVREHRFTFSADIRKVYRQIRLHADHASFLRILWRESREKPLEHYRLLTVTYGTNCAPHDALRVMNHLAVDEGEAFPRASEIIKNQRYMDYVFGGDDDLEKAIEIRDELISVMRRGGFELSKWASNNPKLLNGINSNDFAIEPTVFDDEDRSLKTLGIVWHPKDDQYSFSINLDPVVGLTKRGILSKLSRVFDPLGWLAPVIVLAKLMMQEVWRLKLDWDEPLPESLSSNWEKLRNDLPCVKAIRIDRWLGNGQRTELHGFADASKKAYGAVLYCHSFDDSGVIKSTLIAAKSKIAPITPTTIPRLELCAAVMLSQLMRHYQVILEHRNPKIQCYSDSKVTLCWIARQSADLSVFVRNRVTKILLNCPKECWGYVPTKQNPADVISRGQYPSKLVDNELWWRGPNIVKVDSNPEKWCSEDPNVSQLVDSKLITKLKSCHVTTQSQEHDIDVIIRRFSSLFRLKKVIAWTFRWTRSDRETKLGSDISWTEMKQVFGRIISLVQSSAFCVEFNRCLDKKDISAKSKIRHLSPFIDDGRLMRVGGRLTNANLPEIEKHSIILPSGHLASLIVRETHLNNLHCGVRQTIFLCRRYYWIVNLTRIVKKEIRACERCIRYRGETYQPTMGQLPKFRVTEARAFNRTGVDYAGPFTVRAFRHRGRLNSKGYVAVFVCLATKAVHFELVSSLDTASFLAALERFVARRGNCSELWSDNGRNFVGACSCMRSLCNQLTNRETRTEITNVMAKRRVSWRFIPPYSPHFGGLWESAVKIMKSHLKKTVLSQVLTIEEFNTVLCRIEMIMNSRPIAPMTNHPDDCM